MIRSIPDRRVLDALGVWPCSWRLRAAGLGNIRPRPPRNRGRRMRTELGPSGRRRTRITKFGVRTGVLAAIYVSAVLTVTTLSHLPALAMSFASSAILLAAQPDTAAAQPQALIGGHMIAALCGWTVGSLVGDGVAGAAIAMGAAALLMQVTGTLHPPAAVSGYLMLHQPGHWTWLVFPILCGAILLSLLAGVTRMLVSFPAQARAGLTTLRWLHCPRTCRLVAPKRGESGHRRNARKRTCPTTEMSHQPSCL
jgi:hypothetical protein